MMLKVSKNILIYFIMLGFIIAMLLNASLDISATESVQIPQVIKIKTPSGKGLKTVEVKDLSSAFIKTIITQINLQNLSDDPTRVVKVGELTYLMLPEGIEIYPCKFAIDVLENIYIPDVITNTIVVFSKTGTFIKAIPIPRGKAEKEVTGIDEIVVDGGGIYISNTKIIKKYDFKGNFLCTIRPDGMTSDENVDVLISQLRILPSGHVSFNLQKNWQPISTQIYDESGAFVQNNTAYYFEVSQNRILKILNAAPDVDQVQLYDETENEILNAFNLNFPPNTSRCYIDIKDTLLFYYELNSNNYLHVYAIDVLTQQKVLYLRIDKEEYADDDRFMTDFKVARKGEIFYFMQRNGDQLVLIQYSLQK